MAVKLISVKCPECGATLNIEEDREQAFCTYCGTKVLLHNENEYIYRHIDEAGIKQAETDRIVMLRKMELLEKKRATSQKVKTLKIGITVALGLVMLICFGIGYSVDDGLGALMVGMVCGIIIMFMWMNKGKDEDDDIDLGDKAKVPSSISDYEKKNYSAIEAMFVSAGFTNVRCVPLNDLTMGVLKKPGMVDSITINGREITSGGKKFPKDAAVVISYHSLSR